MIRRNLEKDNLYFEIDLSEVIDGPLNDAQDVRQAVAQDIIDRILERTEDGIDRNGKAFRAPYSKGYQDSKEFKAFGKSANEVNLTLRGQMLDALTVLDVTPDTIKIGFRSGSLQGQKAHGHVTGKEGDVPNMRRDFFGLPEEEILEIVSNYEEQLIENQDEDSTLSDSFLAGELFDFQTSLDDLLDRIVS